MTKMSKHTVCRAFSALTAAIVCLVLVSGCGGSERRLKIGVSQCSDDDWRAKQNAEISAAALAYGVDVAIASANDSDRIQERQIDSLVASGVDLLIVSPNKAESLTPAINRAYDSGIPVILEDRKANSTKYTSFISPDNREIGVLVGSFIAGRYAGKNVRLAEICGLDGSSPADERHDGMMSVLKDAGNVSLVYKVYSDWTSDGGKRAMSRFLEDGVEADVIFFHNDRMASGALELIAERPELKGGGWDMIGVDALPGKDKGIDLVSRGILAASVIYPTRGDDIVKAAVDLLEGKEIPREIMFPSAIVTAENAGVVMLQSEEIIREQQRLEQLHSRLNSYVLLYSHQKIYIILIAVILILAMAVTAALSLFAFYRRKKAQEELAAKIELYQNLGRALKSPLDSTVDPVEQLLDEEDMNERQRSLLELSVNNANVAKALVREMIDYKGIAEGRSNLQEAIGRTSALQRTAVSLSDSFPVRLHTVMDENLSDPSFSVESLGEKLHLSRAQLYRKVKDLTGMSPVEFIREARLDKAAHLLRTTARTVSEIAYEVGFQSPAYFTKCYRIKFGHTPRG